MTFENLYEAFLKQDEEKRVAKGQKALQGLLLELKNKGHDDRQSAKDVKAVIALFTGADKVIHAEEHKLFNKIFNSQVASEMFINHMKKEMENKSIEDVDKLVDSLSEKGKASACTLGLCFLVSDSVLKDKEKEVFERIIK